MADPPCRQHWSWTKNRGLRYRLANRREGEPLTVKERRWFKSIVQRIAAILALAARLDELYSSASENAFTASELGVVR